jgi:hypothetical protein
MSNVWFTGSVSNESIARQVGQGKTREQVIRDGIASTYLTMRTRRPDLPALKIIVDLTDAPGGHAVKWTLHTGDHRPSVFDMAHTTTMRAADWLFGDVEVLR